MEGTETMTNGTTERGTITKDAESTTLIRTVKALDELDATARGRILTYLFSRYGKDC
jgi:hypothetical protein